MRRILIVSVSLLVLAACTRSYRADVHTACPGEVDVTRGALAGGDAGKALAASAFYSFGPRVVLASPECGGLWNDGFLGELASEGAIIRLYLQEGIAPGTYQFLPGGGSAFRAGYAATGPLGSEYWGNGPVSGSLTLTMVDPIQGIRGSYLLDFGGNGIVGGGEEIEEGTFVAPPCDLCGLGQAEAPDAGQPPLGAAGLAACDHLYVTQFTRCGGPVLPAAETSRLRARFEQLCQNQAALPGSGVTAASLEACASDLELSPCGYSETPESCDFRGTLPGGNSCADGFQCASGYCFGKEIRYSTFGPVQPYTCGQCEPVSGVGQPCNSAACPAGSVCISSKPGTSQPAYTCVASARGGEGAKCDGLAALCQPGFSCVVDDHTCRAPAAEGDPCGGGSSSPGEGRGCVAPATCDVSGRCLSGQDGGSCVSDHLCPAGLGCVPDGPCCEPSRVCQPITWAGPGEPCSEIARCLVGDCDFGWPGQTQAPDGGLIWSTCPAVVLDGQPCTSFSTCDTFAECFEGVCTLRDTVACW